MTQPLPDMPARIAKLPRDARGFPVPWFIQWFKNGNTPSAPGVGEPDFRVTDTRKLVRAAGGVQCWICGEPLGQFKAFVIGPMCAINRVVSEPPSHRECAIFAARACPFLSRPRMRRNMKDLPAGIVDAAGVHIDRNPGACAVWVTKSFRAFSPPGGGLLFCFDDPVECLWFTQGRPAKRAEVDRAIAHGFPTLAAIAQTEGPEAVAALDRRRAGVERVLPMEF